VRRASAGSSRFDFELNPQGLGRVDVSLKIDAGGQLSATLSFDNPSAAADAKSRAGDLHQALQQAGFDVSQGGLSFTSGGADQGPAGRDTPAQVYAPTLPTTPDIAAAPTTPSYALAPTSAGGVDITI
jgi:hypothetical protein